MLLPSWRYWRRRCSNLSLALALPEHSVLIWEAMWYLMISFTALAPPVPSALHGCSHSVLWELLKIFEAQAKGPDARDSLISFNLKSKGLLVNDRNRMVVPLIPQWSDLKKNYQSYTLIVSTYEGVMKLSGISSTGVAALKGLSFKTTNAEKVGWERHASTTRKFPTRMSFRVICVRVTDILSRYHIRFVKRANLWDLLVLHELYQWFVLPYTGSEFREHHRPCVVYRAPKMGRLRLPLAGQYVERYRLNRCAEHTCKHNPGSSTRMLLNKISDVIYTISEDQYKHYSWFSWDK